ncbi:1,4-beta-xylanase [Maribellus comscasis]|uniref:1,4-beta-xylanase n=1 Tax=Maribellus comscasis TaxID=2681766 RepID=A0A6I6JYK4_9BACT|nr:1,4-beta-xylanase [Maribellus comscasis]
MVSLFAFPRCRYSENSNGLKSNIWTKEQSRIWQEKNGWLRGCNFIPSTAINQLEMWQVETFDTVTINRELSWAKDIGMNCMRVYLHHVAWEIDQYGFKNRISRYLEIANRYNIKTVFVFFDDCWNPTYKAGKQPDPKPGIHNSGWIRDPGDLLFQDSTLTKILEIYVKDILTSFKDDKRILMWDLYNEPGMSGCGNKSYQLLQNVFKWAWEVRPSQPLTAGVWNNTLPTLNKFQIESSDVITYHTYKDPVEHKVTIDTLKLYGRPMICTEYMAREKNSLFSNIMPMLKKENIGAINWGLVSGKTNTIYAWEKAIPGGSEPELWFHDIFRSDGTPYDKEEIELIRSLTVSNN